MQALRLALWFTAQVGFVSITLAQEPLLRISESVPGTLLGACVASVGDLDGDGRDDLAVGKPGIDQVLVITHAGQSSLNGAIGSSFGHAIARMDDVNGDGIGDFAIGGPTLLAGRVSLISGKDYATLWEADGLVAGDGFGSAIVRVGDCNQDGIDDLAVGAPEGSGQTGYVSCLSGATGAQLTSFVGSAAGDRFGFALAALGDIDGDGTPDLAVGAPRSDVGGSNAGRVRLLSGATGAEMSISDGTSSEEQLGYALANVGDVDFDGWDDLAIGAPAPVPGGTGRVIVRSTGAGTSLVTLQGAQWFGAAVASAGDYDGDCYPDVVIGAPGDGAGFNANPGSARVHSGRDGSELARLGGFWNSAVFPPMPGTGMGHAVAGVGDFNGDGHADVAVGGPHESNFDFNSDGHVAVFGRGSAEVMSIRADTSACCLGSTVRLLGDLNADGADDFAVGTPVRVISGLDGSVLFALAGNGPVGRAGDVDADGTPDVIVGGAPTVVYSGASGAAVLSLPAATAVDGDADLDGDGHADLLTSSGSGAIAYSGRTGAVLLDVPSIATIPPTSEAKNVAFLGDIDGDSIAELLVADTGYLNPLDFTIGALRVISGASGNVLHTFGNVNGFGALGIAVCDAGDFDADGVSDIGVAGEDTTFAYPTIGWAQVYSGATFSLLFDSGAQQLGNWGVRPARSYGFEMRGVGDVDLDGFDDVAISSPFEYGFGFNQWATGQVHVLGGPDGHSLGAVGGFAGYDLHGYSLDGGGDVDRDGIADIVIGVPTDPNNGDFAQTSGSRTRVVRSNFALSQMTPFCTSAPNSQWDDGAHLSASGSSSLARNDLVLHVKKAVTGKTGLFFMGPTQIQTPFGSGVLCVGGPLRRFAPLVVVTGVLGEANRAIDLATPPAHVVTAGTTWYFQFFYRDLHSTNVSDGLAVVFRP